ncbi:MAG: YbaK/EbsC family protein [Hornefia sp.]|nr:YbaK/EbsC family protein [Hornefia sp.]
MENEKRFFKILEELKIKDYKLYEHKALFSVNQEGAEDLMFPGINLKNLLIKDKKSSGFYLMILEDHRKLDFDVFKVLTGAKKTRFATEEELWDLMKITPGSVTPYTLFNDVEDRVKVILGWEITEALDDEFLNFHPCRNTATISVRKKDFLRILEKMGHKPMFEIR